MSKHLGNRIGFGVSSYSDGGFFNLSSQSFLLRKNKWVSKAVVSAAGTSTFSPGNGYSYNIFTSTGPLTVSNGEIYVDYMIVAGGGAGAAGDGTFTDTAGGGGGGGGISEGTVLLFPGSYTITIGGSSSNSSISGPVQFSTITSLAGGIGGVWPLPVSGSPGGSGGGAGGGTALLDGGNGTADQGTPGGNGATLSFSAGGGGGAGGAGTPGTPPGPVGPGGPGGVGRVAFLRDSGIPASYGTPGPTPGRFFGGGGGGAAPGTAGSGGSGGGGAGGIPSATIPLRPGTPGTINTGGGGGGGAASPGGGTGGSGGSGIIILRRINEIPFNVVTNGLTFDLDAGNTSSYPGSGTTWTDLISRTSSGTINNAVYNGANGGVIRYDGTDDYVTIANTNFSISTNFTIELWYKFNSTETNVFNNGGLFTQSALADWNTGTGNNRGLVLGANQIVYVNNASSTVWVAYTTTPSSSTWHHYVFTFNNGTGVVYVDTQVIYNQSNFQTTYAGTLGTFGLGITDTSAGVLRGEMIGDISMFRVYNRTLGLSEIQQNFEARRGRFGI